MRRWTHRAGMAAATAAVMLTTGCGTITGGTQHPVVLVGVDLNLSGRDQPGAVFDNALQLQLDQLREDQQLPGGRQLELRVLDNRGDAATSADNLQQLAADPNVQAIVTAGCPSCVIDLADLLAVPIVSLDPVEAVAAPAAARQWVFRLGPNAGDEADVLSAAMAQAGTQTVGLITVDDPYGEEGATWMEEAAQRDELRIVVHRRITPSDDDSVAAAAAAVASWRPEPDLGPADPFTPEPEQPGPEAVVVWAYAAQAQQVAAALRRAGYPGRVFLDMTAAGELYLTGEAAVLQGATVVFTATPVADQRIASSPALAARQAWVRSYLSRHGTYHMHASWAADALLVLHDAISRAERVDRAGIRAAIESTRIDGMTGQIRFTAEQHSGLGSAALVTLSATGDRWQ